MVRRLQMHLLSLVLVIPTSVTLAAQSSPDSGLPSTAGPMLLPQHTQIVDKMVNILNTAEEGSA